MAFLDKLGSQFIDIHAQHAEPADSHNVDGMEVRFQFAIQSRGLFHLDAAMDGQKMGHSESDHDEGL